MAESQMEDMCVGFESWLLALWWRSDAQDDHTRFLMELASGGLPISKLNAKDIFMQPTLFN